MEGQMVGGIAQPDVAKVVVVGLSTVEEGRGLEHGHRHCSGDPRDRLACVDQLGVDSMRSGAGHRMLLVALKRDGLAPCKPASASMQHEGAGCAQVLPLVRFVRSLVSKRVYLAAGLTKRPGRPSA